MKLVIQIPCNNEQESISEVLENLPKNINGIDEIEILVIDDGSIDDTLKTVQEYNVKCLRFPKKTGLSNVFKKGIIKALEMNADILVNIDGDNQYCSCDIEKLIQPILKNNADMVIGARPINKIKTFSLAKKFFQKLGSFVVKIISSTEIKDASSGFRAFSKNALLNFNIFNDFTYTIETIIQASKKNLIIENIDIDVNEQKSRKSRLFKNNFDYIFKQAINIIRFFIIYSPCRFFLIFANLLAFVAFVLGFRYLYFYFNHDGIGHVQSLILCAIIFTMSFISYMLAIVGDLFSINRKILEDIQYEIRLKKYKK